MIGIPKQISKEAKTLFVKVLSEMKDEQHIKIDNGGFMPLIVEKLGDGFTSAWGSGFIVSFAHYYEQEGDLMSDPEVRFYVIDNREAYKAAGASELDGLGVWPISYTQHNLGIDRELITWDETQKMAGYHPELQNDTATFCTQWFRNIKAQQNIK